jgi:hypothetical protein
VVTTDYVYAGTSDLRLATKCFQMPVMEAKIKGGAAQPESEGFTIFLPDGSMLNSSAFKVSDKKTVGIGHSKREWGEVPKLDMNSPKSLLEYTSMLCKKQFLIEGCGETPMEQQVDNILGKRGFNANEISCASQLNKQLFVLGIISKNDLFQLAIPAEKKERLEQKMKSLDDKLEEMAKDHLENPCHTEKSWDEEAIKLWEKEWDKLKKAGKVEGEFPKATSEIKTFECAQPDCPAKCKKSVKEYDALQLQTACLEVLCAQNPFGVKNVGNLHWDAVSFEKI